MDTKVDISDDTNPKRLSNNKNFQDLDNNELFARLIDDVNGFGWFQKRMWLLSLIASIIAACNHLSPIYIAYSPEHRCVSPGMIYKFQA